MERLPLETDVRRSWLREELDPEDDPYRVMLELGE
jgi:hypothetical protein